MNVHVVNVTLLQAELSNYRKKISWLKKIQTEAK